MNLSPQTMIPGWPSLGLVGNCCPPSIGHQESVCVCVLCVLCVLCVCWWCTPIYVHVTLVDTVTMTIVCAASDVRWPVWPCSGTV